MTIAKTGSESSTAGNGSTVAFSFPYRFFVDTDLKVYVVVDSTNISTLQTLTTHYAIVNTGTEAGGTITMVTPPASGETLLIQRSIPKTQGTDYAANDAFPAETHEAALDRLTLLTQGNERGHITFPDGDDAASILDSADSRASRIQGYDASGNLLTYSVTPIFTVGDVLVYDTVATLQASTEASRGTGAIWEGGGFRYIEVASGGDITNSAGTPVELDVLPMMGSISPEQFGAIGDGATDDAATFRAAWLYLRAQWYDNSKAMRFNLSAKYYLNGPIEDHSLSIFVVDFPVQIDAAPDSEILVDGASTAAIMQFGVGGSFGTGVKGITGALIVRSASGTHQGYRWTDLVQFSFIDGFARSWACTIGHQVINCQEFQPSLHSTLDTTVGLVLESGTVDRTGGTNNIYSTYSGGTSNNNNEFNVTIQNPTTAGIILEDGDTNKISGVAQSSSITGYMLDVVDGDSVHLDSLYLEGGGNPGDGTKNVLRAQATFTGQMLMTNTHMSTTGARVLLEGGLTTIMGGENQGRLTVTGDARVIMSKEPTGGGGGFYSGQTRALNLKYNLPIAEIDDTSNEIAGLPQNKVLYRKGTLLDTESFTYFSGGNSSSADLTKGYRATIAMVKGAQQPVLAEVYVTPTGVGSGTTIVLEEKILTLASISITHTAVNNGSSPFRLLNGTIAYASGDADVLSYEIWVYPFII